MAVTVKVPPAIAKGVDFNIELKAAPAADFILTIEVSNADAESSNREFALKHGSDDFAKSDEHEVFISASSNWLVKALDLEDDDADYVVKLAEKGGTRSAQDDGKVLEPAAPE